MKKHLTFLFAILLVFMAACGSENASRDADGGKGDQEKQTEVSEDDKSSAQKQAEWMEEQEKEGNSEEEYNEETGKGYIEDLGYVETAGIGYSDELGIDGTDAPLKPIEMGPMSLEIEGLAVLDVTPNEDAKELFFDGKEKVRTIVVNMKVENKSEDDITFNPNQAILVTSAGEQVESDMFLMGEAGGDFLGKVKKEDQTWWILQNPDEDISSVKMIISPPYSLDGWDDLAEEKRIDFEVVSWEEAQERDAK